jgi:hypothetical protein
MKLLCTTTTNWFHESVVRFVFTLIEYMVEWSKQTQPFSQDRIPTVVSDRRRRLPLARYVNTRGISAYLY